MSEHMPIIDQLFLELSTVSTAKTKRDLEQQADLTALRAQVEALTGFASDVAKNYDHDADAHRYGTHCRVCSAEAALAKCTVLAATVAVGGEDNLKDYKYRHKYTADQVAKALGFNPKDCEVWMLSSVGFGKNIIEIQCDLPEPPTASNNGFNSTPPNSAAS